MQLLRSLVVAVAVEMEHLNSYCRTLRAMYPHIKKSVRPRRKQDYTFPDGTVPEPKQWICDWGGSWDEARLKREIAEWEQEGMLIYTPRIYYKVELRESVRKNGKPTPKTIKTWFIQKRDFKGKPLKDFWQKITSHLKELGISGAEAVRINQKIAKDIPKA